MPTSKNIALFASGTGSNVQAMIEHFRNTHINPRLIISNNPNAGVLQIAERENIEAQVCTVNEIATDDFIQNLKSMDIRLIVLAGYLKKIPESLIRAFPNAIINIHPALLPKYGGKGMYGMNIHQKVYETKEKESGISIHYVNEQYDEGQLILQARCSITDCHTPEDIAKKVLRLEHYYYPRVVENLLS